ncbi:hypothetical protein MRB53_041579 [Persea americana]|nr:hypothetical protein MRB53_041579 [Persea americana]
MSKLDRRNQAKQKRLSNKQDHAKIVDVFEGKNGAPRVVALVPLCPDVSAEAAVQSLNGSVGISQDNTVTLRSSVLVDRFKQKIVYVPARRDVLEALDVCRVADYVVLLLSAEQEVDDLGEAMIRGIERQGVSTIYTVVQGLNSIEPVKKRTQVVTSLKSFITHFLPTQEKIFSLDTPQECLNVVRSLCTTIPKGIRWRDDRSWMLIEHSSWQSTPAVEVQNDARGQRLGEMVVTGVVRAGISKPTDWCKSAMEVLDSPTESRDELLELAPEEVVMDDADLATSVAPSERRGVLLDDHRYLSGDEDEDEDQASGPRRLPKGTSKYQAAWYIGDVSDSGSDIDDFDEDGEDDVAMNDVAGPADGLEGVAPHMTDGTEIAQSEYPQSEMFEDVAPDQEAKDLSAFRQRRKDQAQEDLRFPDEIELHPNVLARERLARYRGLKSLRTSTWDTEEDKPYQPEEWARLLDINDYKAAKSTVLRESLVGGVKPGTRVQVHLSGVPESLAQSQSLSLFALLRHEQKRTAMNFNLTLDSDYPEPIKAKEELIIQCGPRRMVVKPVFSQAGNTPNNVHKFERFLHPGRTTVATFNAPLIWGSVPALVFKRTTPPNVTGDDVDMTSSEQSPRLTLIGHGTSLPASTSRVIAKRIVLTGEPYKINRKLVTVRYMFFNTEDVAWFKALQLWTNRGRQGTIKESLGTHGYFKATFDAKVGMQDAIGISLYKRVWPRTARPWRADRQEDAETDTAVPMLVS